MLIRHNGAVLRLLALVMLASATLACGVQTVQAPAVTVDANPAFTPAADLRTHLNLLLAEHVMIVAKETEAAVNHSDEYAPYTALLAVNTSELSAVIGRALGSTAATHFDQVWNMQNGFLVDYAIGVVTHDDDKAKAAITGLRSTFVLQLQDALGGLDEVYKVGGPLGTQIDDEKIFIDDLFAQKYAYFYGALHDAYNVSQEIGDALAFEIVNQFPDKFPGRIDGRDVIDRVNLNLLLQEHSYLATMATDAATAKRDSEKNAAVAALGQNAGKSWSDWDAALVAYASGRSLQQPPLVDKLVSSTGAPRPAVNYYVQAAAKVVDDQKAKASKTLADDDRAAATAMQPIADALVQG